MEKATEARAMNNVGALADETNHALINIKMENNLTKLTVSEKMDKLIEQGILNQDRTFVQNNNYKLSYMGNIKDKTGKIVYKLTCFNDNITQKEKTLNKSTSTYSVYKEIKIVDGDAQISKSGSNDIITLTPINNPKGYKFAYWINENDDIVSYKKNCEKIYAESNYLTAIFVKDDINVQEDLCVSFCGSDRIWQNDGVKQLVRATSAAEKQGAWVINEVGILRTNESSSIENLYYNSTDTNVSTSHSSGNISGNNNFTYGTNFSLSATSAPKIWYYKGYCKYKNTTTNEERIVYSNLYTSYPCE